MHSDTGNIASRPESFDKHRCLPDLIHDPCRILLGDATHYNVDHHFSIEGIGGVRFKVKELEGGSHTGGTKMKYIGLATSMLMAGFILVVPLLNATSGDPKIKTTPMVQAMKPQDAAVKPPLFRPPRVGRPKTRLVGGGSRGIAAMIKLSALAPEQDGLTVQEQPSLFWYLSQKTTDTIELIVSVDRAKQPMLVTCLRPPSQPGIQRVRLTDYNIRLETGVTYRWFIALIPDLEHRSKELIAGGGVERISLSDSMRNQLDRTEAEHRPHLYAEAGLWYDALASLSDLIEATPANLGLRQQRAALLQQVGSEVGSEGV